MNTESKKQNRENRKSHIRILVVDDSLSVRKRIIKILEFFPDVTVIGEGRNGREAIELTKKLRPSVILMDIVMPVMNGLDATEYIMDHHPTPIVIHSSSENRGNAFKILDTLKAGALASIEKTDALKDPERWQKDLIRTLRAASRVHVSRRGRPSPAGRETEGPHMPPRGGAGDYSLVAIGASTGGPGVIVNILKSFPSHFSLPILLVIHIGSSGNAALAEWLNDNCRLNVSFAANRKSLDSLKGNVIVAPPDRHMVLEDNKICLLDAPPVNFCRPSVDVFFQSIAKDATKRAIAVLLTGMGKDGSLGLKAIRDGGGYTICQDEATSIIFGMPRAAIDMGAAEEVLPDNRIGEKIMAVARGR